MLKKIISVLILSAILVSSFGVIAFADDEICPYSDTSIIPLSREEFLTTYAEQLGLSPEGSEIPEDDYIFLVRNEFGDYGDLFRFDNSGRIIKAHELRIFLDHDVEIDYDTMNNTKFLKFLKKNLKLRLINLKNNNEIGFYETFTNEDDYYPYEFDVFCDEPIVTEFFLFTKSDNFSGITYATTTIENIYPRDYNDEYYVTNYSSAYKPLTSMVDGELSNSITVGEGGNVHTVTYLDDDEETVLWESLVPTGVKASKIFLNFETKTSPGFKHIFSGWAGYTDNPVTRDMTFVAEYADETDPRGDINEDGRVDTKDVVELLRGLKSGGSGLDRERADVNLDGVVGYDDVTYMLEAFTEAREW